MIDTVVYSLPSPLGLPIHYENIVKKNLCVSRVIYHNKLHSFHKTLKK